MHALSKKMLFTALNLAAISAMPVFAQDLIADDLITSSAASTPWLECGVDGNVVDVTLLDSGLCAFRTTPVEPGVAYRMSCGANVVKFASITLAFQDIEANTLATRTTEIAEDNSGTYTVELVAPEGTITGAIGIYGEPGTGFQDCVLLDATPEPEPTKGSISGTTWFDENRDSILDAKESRIANTSVTLINGSKVVGQTTTNNDGAYYFGHLDTDQCYVVSFMQADASLEFTFGGEDHDVISDGQTDMVCPTERTPDITGIDAGFIPAPVVVAPADFAICGVAWIDANANGSFDDTDSTRAGVAVSLLDSNGELLASGETDSDGNYVFNRLASGGYAVQFQAPNLHEATVASSEPELGLSVISQNGRTATFSIPDDSNTDEGSACTLANINGGFVPTVVTLEPTIANDDQVAGEVGDELFVSILDNDSACDATVENVDIIGHNVPGTVSYNADSQQIVISSTTADGTYSIEYGLRGACGSYDTATVLVELERPVVVQVDNVIDAPICRVETGGARRNGGVDVFHPEEFGFAQNYNLYDRDRNLVITLDSTDVTHKRFLGRTLTSQGALPYIGNYEIEWNGANYGYDQVSIHFVEAVDNGSVSELTRCDRLLISPIAIDLENKGRIERLVGDYQVDMDGDGISEHLSQWFAPSAGILIDVNAIGQITGDALFGNIAGKYADGFEKLAKYDADNSGHLVEGELQGLAIWNDANSDTVVQTGEVSSLASHKIIELPLEHYKYMARATRSNGKALLMEDVWFPLAPLALTHK